MLIAKPVKINNIDTIWFHVRPAKIGGVTPLQNSRKNLSIPYKIRYKLKIWPSNFLYLYRKNRNPKIAKLPIASAGWVGYSGMLGGFTVQTEDGKLKTKVGSGLTDSERKQYAKYLSNPEGVIGKLIEVEYTEITYDTNSNHVLDHPVWGGFRTDKKSADTLQHILDEG